MACLFLRYQRGELSWATFLRETGDHLDSANGRRACEDFYALLTDLERTQRAAIEREFQGPIARIDAVYRVFAEYFRRFAASQGR